MTNWLAQHLDRNPEMARLPVYKRDRYSLHVRQRDGSVMAEFATRPLHYQDERGIWQPLDTSLRAVGNEYGAPGLDVFVAPDGGVRVAGTKHHQRTGRVVVLDITTGKVKRVVAGDLGAGRIEDDSLLRDAGPLQHRLRVTATGLREELTINSPLGGISAAEWLMIETEMQGRSLPDGWMENLAWAGRYQFRPPVCTDAKGARIAARQYALRQGNRQMLYTGVPLAWLAGAVYPVVLDPDFAVAAADGFVQGTSYSSFADARATCTYFSSTDATGLVGNVLVSGKSTYWTCNRGYLAFATAGIGTNPVLAATLRLAVSSYDFAQLQDDLEITKFNWSAWNPVGSGNQEAIYDAALAAPKDVAWQSQGFGFTNNTYYDSADPLDASWINRIGTTYYGLLAKHDRDAVAPNGNESISFNTSESSYPPILRVIYGEAAVDASAIAAAVLAAMNLTPPAVNVTMWKDATAPAMTGDAYARLTGTVEPAIADVPTAAAAAILVTPANKLATGATGQAYADVQSWLGIGPNALSSGNVRTYPDGTLLRYELGMAAANLDTQLAAVAKTGADGDTLETLSDQIDAVLEDTADVPTVAEFEARTLLAADYTVVSDLPSVPAAAAVADAVWDEAIAGHASAGTTGAALAAAGSAGDPWITDLPGDYAAGTAGAILGGLPVTLANVGATVTVVSAVSGGNVTVYANDTWRFAVTDATLALSGYEALALVVKRTARQDDNEAILYLRSDTGLARIDGAAPISAANGTLTKSSTSFTAVIAIAETVGIANGKYTWWLKGFDATPTPNEGLTLAVGTFTVADPGLQAIA